MNTTYSRFIPWIAATCIAALGACDEGTTPLVADGSSDATAETLTDTFTPDATPETAVDTSGPETAIDTSGPETVVDAAPNDLSTPDGVTDVAGDEGVQAPGCPPEGPYGHAQGETLTNYTLTTCDGEPYDVHDLCGADAALIFNYYGWCPPCQTFAAGAEALFQARKAQGFKLLFVVAQKSNATPPDATYCQQVKDSFGLTMDVVYDPTGLMTAYGTNDTYLVSDEAAVIAWKQKYPSSSAVTSAIDAELAD